MGYNNDLQRVIDYMNYGMKKKSILLPPDSSVQDKLDAILKFFDRELPKDAKHVKLPFNVRAGVKSWHKRKTLMVFYLSNRGLDILIKKVKNETIEHKGNIHSIPPEAIFLYKGKTPAVILPSDRITPITIEEINKNTEKDRNYVDAQSYAIRAINKAGVQALGSKLGGKSIIWIGLVIIVVLYFIFG